jgi:hypothetical protein
MSNEHFEKAVSDISDLLDHLGETFDTKILAAVMGTRVSRLYQMLIAADLETPESVAKIYGILQETALEPAKSKPTIMNIDTDGTPVTKQ